VLYFGEQCTLLFLSGNSNPRLSSLQSSHYTNCTTPAPLSLILQTHSLHFSTLCNKPQKLSTCNDVSVTWIAEVSMMDLHQPRCWNNHFAVFLWTNLHQHFACMFPSRHVPATELLNVSVSFSDNSNVMSDTSL